jgi:DNA-binding transcriptional LysR family regulator
METLKVFCDIVDFNSFLKAGEKNLLSQSAVSQQLAQLELAYKCQLLDRKRKPFKLTSAGELVYNASRDILERFERFNNDLSSLQKTTANRINIAAIYSIGMHSLPPYVKTFMAKYPDINVHVEYLSSRQIYELVLRETIDIGLVAVPQKDRYLQTYHFRDEPLVFVCSPENPLANQSQIDIHKLHLENFVAFEKGVPTRTLIDSILANYNVVVRRVMEFDNIETVKRAVEIDAGVSVLPQTTIRQELANGTLRAIPFSNENFVRPTGIIVRKGKNLSQPGRYFLELLRKRIGGKDLG